MAVAARALSTSGILSKISDEVLALIVDAYEDTDCPNSKKASGVIPGSLLVSTPMQLPIADGYKRRIRRITSTDVLQLA